MKTYEINIDLLNQILSFINELSFNSNELNEVNIEQLYKYISKDDLIELLNILNKIKKSNLKKIYTLLRSEENDLEQDNLKIESGFCTNDVINIFNELTNEAIQNKYSLKELKSMYYCIYSEAPSKNKTKKNIVDIIRNYIYISNRASEFNL